MKKRWIFWWSANIVWILLFVTGTAVIWLREVDGAGVPQTPEIKLFTFMILLMGFAIPVIIQIVWLIIIQEISKNN